MATYISVTISVYDSVTNVPLSGAMVYVNGTVNFDPTQFSVSTNVSGAATFQIPVSPTNGGNAQIQVTAANYQNQSQLISTTGGSPFSALDFPMVMSTPPGAPIVIQFSPATPGINWQLINSASAQVDSGVSQNDGSTNSSFVVINGSYTVSATAIGYQNANAAIQVNGQTDPYTVTLVANTDPNTIQTGNGVPGSSGTNSTVSTTNATSPPSSEFTYPNSDYDKYFTITGVRIYIGNMFIDEVNSIQYALQDNAVPVFGYSSRFYDALAQGRSMVQGQIALNFVSEGYLYTVLNDYAALQAQGGADLAIDSPGLDVVAQILGLMTARNNLQQQASNNSSGTITPPSTNTSDTSTTGNSVPALQPGSVVSPTTVGTSAETGPAATSVNQTAQVIALTAQITALTASLTPDQVDDLNTQQQQSIGAFSDVIGFANAVYQDVIFDIQIDFGNEITGVKRVRYLEDCKLISNEQVIAPDGQTILDSYGFIARRLR